MANAVEQASEKHGRISRAESSLGAGSFLCVLDPILKLFEALGKEFSNDQSRIRELRERLVKERFHLAVLGQFKRGKSTLINAFLGEPLLPVSVLPLTSIPTFLRPGPRRLLRVFFLDGRSEELKDLSCGQAADLLARYVTEERNPENKLGVARVEVEYPSSALSRGVMLIDTPGIGSTFRHNTDATLRFLPQCDAAIFVVSADPPITEVELEFLKAVRGKMARLFFVMNKADYLSGAERDRAVEFFKKVLEKQVGVAEDEPVFSVSAKLGLEGKSSGNRMLWQESGMQELQAYLLDFLARGKARALQLALAKKALDVVAGATMHIQLQRGSLQMPLDQLEKRIRIFDEKIREAERERIAIGDLLAGDRKRTVEFLEEKAEQARQKARGHFQGITSGMLLNAENPESAEEKVQGCLAEQIPAFFEEELKSFSGAIGQRVSETLQAHQERADRLSEGIRQTAAELFEIPYHAPDSLTAFEKVHEPYWVTYNWDTSLGDLPVEAVEHFLPARIRMRRFRRRISKDIETLVVRNVENIRWATLQNLDQSFRQYSAVLDERLKVTVEATHGAIQAAHLQRKERAETVQSEIKRLEQKRAELGKLEESLAKFADLASENG
ncbi:MAG: dynamin family protein [Deltaproteobacteria bacterium]|nr:dynamin family protein [Deltaproteobacteria bacterium]